MGPAQHGLPVWLAAAPHHRWVSRCWYAASSGICLQDPAMVCMAQTAERGLGFFRKSCPCMCAHRSMPCHHPTLVLHTARD